MSWFFKKLFFSLLLKPRMFGYVDDIMLALYNKLWTELEKQHDHEKAKLLSAAVSNRLFGIAASPMHTNIPATLIDELAIDFLRKEEDEDLLHGIVMSLRTSMTLEASACNTEAMNRISDTVQWIKSIIPIPPEAPNPDMMKKTAAILQSRYNSQRR